MGKYIKYTRVKKTISPKELNEFLDSLIIDNCEIIYYNESTLKYNLMEIIILYGKINNNNKIIL
jgi:hypothetical protein